MSLSLLVNVYLNYQTRRSAFFDYKDTWTRERTRQKGKEHTIKPFLKHGTVRLPISLLEVAYCILSKSKAPWILSGAYASKLNFGATSSVCTEIRSYSVRCSKSLSTLQHRFVFSTFNVRSVHCKRKLKNNPVSFMVKIQSV